MANYVSAITTAGLAKIADSIANSTVINFTHLAIGDGNGADIFPASNMTSLVHEVWRGGVDGVSRDPGNPNQVIIQATVPLAAGPFTLREVAIYTSDGVMFAIGAYPEAFKPTPAQGATVDVVVQYYIAIASSASVTVTMQPDNFVGFNRMRLPFLTVDSGTTLVPPLNPPLGATYLVPSGASAPWNGHADELAQHDGYLWNYKVPPLSTIIGEADTGAYKRYTASGWVALDLTGQGALAYDWKASCRVATIAPLAALTGLLTVDGVTLAAGNRVLVKDQAASQDNGIWLVAAGAWTRTTDANASAKVTSGLTTFVEDGATNASNIYVLSTKDPIVLGTTGLTFVVGGGAGPINVTRLTGIISNLNLPTRLQILAVGGPHSRSVAVGSLIDEFNGPAGQNRGLNVQSGGSMRWLVAADATAESGGNSGSNFGFFRYDDSGTYSGLALSINRSNGDVAIERDVSVGRNASAAGQLSSATLTTSGNASIGADLSAARDAAIGRNLTVAGTLASTGAVSTASTLTATGYLKTSAGIYFADGSYQTVAMALDGSSIGSYYLSNVIGPPGTLSILPPYPGTWVTRGGTAALFNFSGDYNIFALYQRIA
jgi:Phage tail-collar fibre protein/Protein of unknown function (DUF2793)